LPHILTGSRIAPIMMTILRFIIGLAAIIVLVTVAFGQSQQIDERTLQNLLQQNTLLPPAGLATEPLSAPLIAPPPPTLTTPQNTKTAAPRGVTIPVSALPRTSSPTLVPTPQAADPLSDAEFESLLDDVTADLSQLATDVAVQNAALETPAIPARLQLTDPRRLDGICCGAYW